MSKYEITGWFDRGYNQGDRYMSIYWDTYDNWHYPVYIADDESYFNYVEAGDVRMEVYDLQMDKGSQLNEGRVHNGPKVQPPAPRRSARLAAKTSSQANPQGGGGAYPPYFGTNDRTTTGWAGNPNCPKKNEQSKKVCLGLINCHLT